jgi:hypothetical protein
VDLVGIAAIPGNHDCNFSLASDVRPILIGAVAGNLESIDLGSDAIQQLLRIQSSFFDFEKEILALPAKREDQLAWQFVYPLSPTENILVRCLNTALASRIKEEPGQLFFPLQALGQTPPDVSLAITCFHHPYGWLEPINRRGMTTAAQEVSDIILTGHEHDPDSHTNIDKQGGSTSYVEGGVLQGESKTGFNFVKVDLLENSYEVIQFAWENGLYHPQHSRPFPFVRKAALIENKFDPNPQFRAFLQDPGTGFLHPDKKLLLEDMFVYPSITLTTLGKSSGTTIHSNDVFGLVQRKQFLNIAGTVTSGKSALAKKLYVDLHHQLGRVPVLLSGSNLKSLNMRRLMSAVNKEFSTQYTAEQLSKYQQLPPERKVLIVDDWHKVQLGSDAKHNLLMDAGAHFGQVITFTSDTSLYQQMTIPDQGGALPGIEYCEIAQFGFRLRTEMIRKWQSIGQEFDNDDLELTKKFPLVNTY